MHRPAKDRNQALTFGPFLANPAVTAQEMLATVGRLSGERASGWHALAIEDTTELHLATHEASKRGFGRGGKGADLGLFPCPVLAWLVARLGGWSGCRSKGYKPSGPKTMHHGLLRLDPILLGWRLAQNRSADVRFPSPSGLRHSHKSWRDAARVIQASHPG
ncbi:MAG: hypothetical protein ACREFP_16020 [Acetobacteraceae bacterium]